MARDDPERSMRLLTAISLTFAALIGACSVKNPNHCANKDGDSTCKLLYGETYVCSQCTSENSGCVIGPVLDICEADATSGADTSLATTVVDPSTTTTAPTTSTSTTTTTTTTTDPTTGPPETTTETTDPTTGGSTTTTTDTTTDTDTTAGPMCGNDMIEAQETCDGADLGGLTCVSKSEIYNGGVLKCIDDCSAFDESDCCLGPGEDCLVNGQQCCPGTSCQLLGPSLLSCKP
jgi:hypothetical protein